MPDHVHLLARLAPKTAPAEFIGQVKGATSFRVNREIKPRFELSWQDGYGVFSLRKDELEMVSRYIDRQEEHHRSGKLSVLLETMDVDEDDWPSESEMAEADGASPVNRAE
ncbi:MAG: IS200/IS605 family transposase [Blastocatellia bacterium]